MAHYFGIQVVEFCELNLARRVTKENYLDHCVALGLPQLYRFN